ncbi:MAG: LUD domain-containing protein [Solirubrobacterales bacterium]|nr:LUD domain-containing protein [Solirubrobacterales bacterium]
MSGAREEILARIASALSDVPAGEVLPPVGRDYRRGDARPRPELVALLAQRLGDYGAVVRRVHAAEVSRAVERECERLGLRRLVGPPGLPTPWRPASVELVADDGLSARALDAIDGALTGCATAIAETGTLVLDGGPLSGRRLLTLVPDHHICVVGAEQVVGQVPEAIAQVASAVRERRAPVTLISGASATSDIELSRVEGVHGPRHLVVLVVDDDQRAPPA